MQKKTKEKHFIKKPIYIGGLKAMREFVAKEMKYPKKALENKIEGTVYLKYQVDYKGTVVSSKVLSSLGHGCDEEAKRIVSKMKFYVGKNPRKMKLKFSKTLKIHFRLPKTKVAPTPKQAQKPKANKVQRKIKYTITSTKPTKEPITKKSSYSYTIKF